MSCYELEISQCQKIENELQEALKAAKLRLQTGTGTQRVFEKFSALVSGRG